MQTADIWLRDMPQQFRGKHNIGVLVKAFSRQIQELEKVFRDLGTMTDIDTATGKNLDYIGTIIPLTRKEAGELAGTGVTGSVISDDRYRQLLRYQNLVNTNNCTYYDIMDGLHLLWGTGDNPVFYTERKNRPATVFIGLHTVSVDDGDSGLPKGFKIKAAGVGLVYVFRYDTRLYECPGNVRPACVFALYVSFWDSRIYRGARRYNGAARYNAGRNYGLRVRIKSLYELYTGHDTGCAQTLLMLAQSCLEVNVINTCQRFGITDGAFQESRLSVHVRLNPLHGGTCVQVITQRNVVRYNGARRYNGAMKYNALYRKEGAE